MAKTVGTFTLSRQREHSLACPSSGTHVNFREAVINILLNLFHLFALDMLCYKLDAISSSLYRSCFVFVIASSIRSLRDTVF